MDDLPSRRSSPRLLPPRGERRDFGFHATNHFPPAYPDHPPFYPDDPPTDPFSDAYRTETWPTTAQQSNGLFLPDGPPGLLTTEPDAMTDDEVSPNMLVRRPSSRASRWSHHGRGGGRGGGGGGGAGWTHPHHPLPLRAPRSRAVSPVFSARRTREFLSPRPRRAARFDFGAWGVERASRSSLGLGLGHGGLR
jgi:hypothetical protein